ncbi:RteC domain-containing protein [Xanthomarina sp.]|uniref:RteC domain-containing protein n=1 Tax=Xanthomarina sp. TaxID=1931211 RepID=UPI002BD134A5|nr:RteC domain-containing protein [Xanthomarina sp.]HLV38541.1 RteC domain-containing protein [Xanthomarina sp.]
MIKIDKILKDFDKEIENLEKDIEDVLFKAEKGIKLSKQALIGLRILIIENGFKNAKNEIQFFKNIKPQIYSRLIYYVILFNIESKRPRGSSKPQKKYLDYHICKLQNYFNDNLEFYQYFRRGGTSLDALYFIRGKDDIRLHPDNFHFFIDEKFSTSHDSTVAIIVAYDMLIVYLKQEIDRLENKSYMETSCQTSVEQSRLFWTANKTDLIELIYALHSSSAVNSGTADIKEIATACEQLFNIDLGDYYRAYLEIRSRKTSRTKFLDKMKDSIISRMDYADE